MNPFRRRSMWMAAAVVDDSEIAAIRTQLIQLAEGVGARRLHFVRESTGRKQRLIDALTSMDTIRGIAVAAPVGHSTVKQRDAALGTLAQMLVERSVRRIVLDHVEPVQQHRDRRVLSDRTHRSISYGHELPRSPEPLLWVADAIAWCAGEPTWRPKLDGWVELVWP